MAFLLLLEKGGKCFFFYASQHNLCDNRMEVASILLKTIHNGNRVPHSRTPCIQGRCPTLLWGAASTPRVHRSTLARIEWLWVFHGLQDRGWPGEGRKASRTAGDTHAHAITHANNVEPCGAFRAAFRGNL